MNAEKTIKKKAAAEKRKLKKLILAAGVSEERIKILDSVMENAAWMKVKLDETREYAEYELLTVEYDNGGGQQGIRENPTFKGYAAMWKNYMSAINMLLSNVPEAKQVIKPDDSAKPQSMLELIRAKKNKEA